VSSCFIQGRTWADADAAHSSVSTWVPAQQTACFDYVADFSRHDEWTTNPVKIAALDDDSHGLGARYRAVGRQAGKDWPSELEVTVYDRPLTFEFTAARYRDPSSDRVFISPQTRSALLELPQVTRARFESGGRLHFLAGVQNQNAEWTVLN